MNRTYFVHIKMILTSHFVITSFYISTYKKPMKNIKCGRNIVRFIFIWTIPRRYACAITLKNAKGDFTLKCEVFHS